MRVDHESWHKSGMAHIQTIIELNIHPPMKVALIESYIETHEPLPMKFEVDMEKVERLERLREKFSAESAGTESEFSPEEFKGPGIFIKRRKDRVETDLVWHRVESDVTPPEKQKILVLTYTEDDKPWIRYVQGQFLKNLSDAQWWAYLNDPKPLL